ncbi:hypothetical protein A3Q56_00525 [Intoshia linei]|uniref:Uncharacterized protein n=1 Tax=Intoshia linei TaxID=1819745 RepID=A0A177BBI8_9BILA|nr:hypothetical protein A3Q56_00525 [Intoshia linei]
MFKAYAEYYPIFVVISSFLIFFVIDGWTYTLSVIFKVFQKKYNIKDSQVVMFLTLTYALPDIIGKYSISYHLGIVNKVSL